MKRNMKALSKKERKERVGVPRMYSVINHLMNLRNIMETKDNYMKLMSPQQREIYKQVTGE